MSDSCNHMNCIPLGFSVCGVSQARILEWVFICFSWLRSSDTYIRKESVSLIPWILLFHLFNHLEKFCLCRGVILHNAKVFVSFFTWPSLQPSPYLPAFCPWQHKHRASTHIFLSPGAMIHVNMDTQSWVHYKNSPETSHHTHKSSARGVPLPALKTHHTYSCCQCQVGTWKTNRPVGWIGESLKGTSLHETIIYHRAEVQFIGQRTDHWIFSAGTLEGNKITLPSLQHLTPYYAKAVLDRLKSRICTQNDKTPTKESIESPWNLSNKYSY